MTELALISKAAPHHQDADTVHANLRADVNAALASSILSENDRAKVADSLLDNAQDLRRDLMTLARFELAADLAETEIKVRSLTDEFLSQAIATGQLALQDPKAAEPLKARFCESGESLHAAMDRQTAAFTTHIVQTNEAAADAAAIAKRWLIWASILTTVLVGPMAGCPGRFVSPWGRSGTWQ